LHGPKHETQHINRHGTTTAEGGFAAHVGGPVIFMLITIQMTNVPQPNEHRAPALRPGFALACSVVVAAGVAGFFGGSWWARYEAQQKSAKLLASISRSDQARTAFFLNTAIEDLRAGRTAEGENKQLRYAKLQAAGSSDCRRSPECKFWVGQFLLSDEQLATLAAMKERP
jgi:hypothetical protein